MSSLSPVTLKEYATAKQSSIVKATPYELLKSVRSLFSIFGGNITFESSPTFSATIVFESSPCPGLSIGPKGRTASCSTLTLTVPLPPCPENLAAIEQAFSVSGLIPQQQVFLANAAFHTSLKAFLPDLLVALDIPADVGQVSLELLGTVFDTCINANRVFGTALTVVGGCDNCFATLLVELPGVYDGGVTDITFDSRVKSVDFQDAAGSNVLWCATKLLVYYNCCDVRISPIMSGCRVRLLYGLKWHALSPAPQPSRVNEATQESAGLLLWLQQAVRSGDHPAAVAKLGLMLREEYTKEELQAEGLNGVVKAKDRWLLGLLQEVNSVLPEDSRLAFHLVRVTRYCSQRGHAEEQKTKYVGDNYSDYSGYDEEDLDAYESDDFITDDDEDDNTDEDECGDGNDDGDEEVCP